MIDKVTFIGISEGAPSEVVFIGPFLKVSDKLEPRALIRDFTVVTPLGVDRLLATMDAVGEGWEIPRFAGYYFDVVTE